MARPEPTDDKPYPVKFSCGHVIEFYPRPGHAIQNVLDDAKEKACLHCRAGHPERAQRASAREGELKK